MATRQSTVDALLDLVARAGDVSTRKMFGEYCVYLDGKPVALVCDDRLLVKPTAAGRGLVPGIEEVPPFPGCKPYLLVPTDDEGWAARETLCDLLQVTRDALPPPKPRRPRKARRPARDA